MDSLEKAMRSDMARFLSYVNLSNVKSVEDFIREFRKAFDTSFGTNMLNYMKNSHWQLLLDSSVVKKHLKNIEQQQQLKDFVKGKILSKVLDLARSDKETSLKFIEVTREDGTTYKRSNQPWTDKQKEFLSKNKNEKPSIIYEAYNKIFKVFRSKSSISSRVYRERKNG